MGSATIEGGTRFLYSKLVDQNLRRKNLNNKEKPKKKIDVFCATEKKEQKIWIVGEVIQNQTSSLEDSIAKVSTDYNASCFGMSSKSGQNYGLVGGIDYV